MTAIKIWLLGGGLAAAVGAGYALASQPEPVATSRAARPRSSSENVVVQHRWVVDRGSESAERARIEAAPEPAPADQRQQEPPDPSVEDVAAELDVAFETDAPPDRDAARLAANIGSAFRVERASGARLGDVQCRATRCRMQLEFTNEAADRQVLMELFSLLAESGVDTRGLRFTVPVRDVRADGTVGATVHLFRGDAEPG